MSLKTLLKSFTGGDDQTIARLTAKLATAQTELATAQQEANAAFLEDEASDTDAAHRRATKARDALEVAQLRFTEISGALAEARARKQNAQDAERTEAERQRKAALVAARDALQEAADAIEPALGTLIDSLREFREARHALGALQTSLGGELTDLETALMRYVAHELDIKKSGASYDVLAAWQRRMPVVQA